MPFVWSLGNKALRLAFPLATSNEADSGPKKHPGLYDFGCTIWGWGFRVGFGIWGWYGLGFMVRV